MGKVGDALHEARKRKNWSLAQAEGATRIRQQYLSALEKEHFAEFASEAQIRGFLRTYALTLGLDPEEILEYYDAEPRKASRRPTIPRPRSLSPWSVMNISILLVIVVIIVLMGTYVMSRQAAPASTPPPAPTATPVVQVRTVPLYTLEVSLDYEGHSFHASERLDFANTTEDSLAS